MRQSLGCCEMNTDRLSDALGSFSRVVGLNSSNGEAWANMAAIHCRRSNWCEAFVCIREAVKYCRENWRIWDSYVKISVKVSWLCIKLRSMNKYADVFCFCSSFGMQEVVY